MEPLALEITGVSSGYGRVQVLWDVSFSVKQGSSIVLLGANGAGKTTLLKVVVGLVKAWSGDVKVFGEDIGRLNTSHRVRTGIAYMSEQGIFPSLSVKENLALGAGRVAKSEVQDRLATVYEMFPELVQRGKSLAGSLSGGQRKMVGISKCLMSKPKLLILDEPSSGLSPRYVAEVVEQLQTLRGVGITMVVAEQNVSFLETADSACVLEGGRINFAGGVEEFEGDEALHAAFFGLEGIQEV